VVYLCAARILRKKTKALFGACEFFLIFMLYSYKAIVRFGISTFQISFLQGPESWILVLICLFKDWASSITIYHSPLLFFYFWLRKHFIIHSPPTCLVVWVFFFWQQLGSLSWKRGPVCKCYWLQSAARHTHSFSRADERANGLVHSRITLIRP
jgi:hypothetical protein